MAEYTARLEQTVSPIANGSYEFSVWIQRDAAEKFTKSYLFAEDFNVADPDDADAMITDAAIGNTWVKVTLGPIVVTSNELTVGVQTIAAAGGWINLDDAELKLIPE